MQQRDRMPSRWWRGDAARWVRPDAARWFKPGVDLREALPALKAFNPNQPRVPAGDPDGGQWTDGYAGGDYFGDDDSASLSGGVSPSSGLATPMGDIDFGDIGDELGSLGLFEITPREIESDDFVQLASDDGRRIVNEFGEPYYQRRGHHEILQSRYDRWDLLPETRRVVRESSTGALPPGYRNFEGQLRGHYWDDAHRQYAKAFDELTEKFFRENKIEPSRMTPDQARNLMQAIRESDDPRIRDYNRAMRYISRSFRIRGVRE